MCVFSSFSFCLIFVVYCYDTNMYFCFSSCFSVYVSVEESQKGTSFGNCTIQLRGLDIKNVEPGVLGLGRSDPFYEISRKNADHSAGVVRWYVILVILLYLCDFLFTHLFYKLIKYISHTPSFHCLYWTCVLNSTSISTKKGIPSIVRHI